MPNQKTVKDYIRTIVDFPHEGIMFRDVTTLFNDPRGIVMVAVGLGSIALGAAVMMKMVRFDI